MFRFVSKIIIKALQGDLEFVRDGWCLESAGSSHPCPVCRCNASTIPWSDHRASALWRTAGWPSKEEWEAGHPQRSGVFSLPGLWGEHVFIDVMHTKHLGCDAYLAGSFFSYIVEHKRPPGTGEAARMQELWTRIREVYKDPPRGKSCGGNLVHAGLFFSQTGCQ